MIALQNSIDVLDRASAPGPGRGRRRPGCCSARRPRRAWRGRRRSRPHCILPSPRVPPRLGPPQIVALIGATPPDPLSPGERVESLPCVRRSGAGGAAYARPSWSWLQTKSRSCIRRPALRRRTQRRSYGLRQPLPLLAQAPHLVRRGRVRRRSARRRTAAVISAGVSDAKVVCSRGDSSSGVSTGLRAHAARLAPPPASRSRAGAPAQLCRGPPPSRPQPAQHRAQEVAEVRGQPALAVGRLLQLARRLRALEAREQHRQSPSITANDSPPATPMRTAVSTQLRQDAVSRRWLVRRRALRSRILLWRRRGVRPGAPATA